MIEEIILVDNIVEDPIATVSARMVLFQATEDNVINMARTIQDYEQQIQKLKDELTLIHK